MEIEPSMSQVWQVTSFLNAARLAYGLDTCHGYGLNDSRYNMEDCDGQSVIFANYNRDHRGLFEADVADFIVWAKG